jgi:hypothetical protein
MKLIAKMGILFILFVGFTYFLIQIKNETKCKSKFQIIHFTQSGNYVEYSDSLINITSTSVEYTDENGNAVVKGGSFSVKRCY